jgi:hypothetical protein
MVPAIAPELRDVNLALLAAAVKLGPDAIVVWPVWNLGSVSVWIFFSKEIQEFTGKLRHYRNLRKHAK